MNDIPNAAYTTVCARYVGGGTISVILATSRESIERGEYVEVDTRGNVIKCKNTDVLMDPLGDIHYSYCIGYAIDDIVCNGVGRVVVDW